MIIVENLEDGIAIVTLERAHAANAMTLPMVALFHSTIARLGADRQVRVVVLAAAGRAFCAGLDLKAVLLADDAPKCSLRTWTFRRGSPD